MYTASSGLRKKVRITDNWIYGFPEYGWVAPTGNCGKGLLSDAQEDAEWLINKTSAQMTGDYVFSHNHIQGGPIGFNMVDSGGGCTEM